MSENPSKYRFITRSDGFRIEAPDRTPVSVRLCETGFHILDGEERQLTLFDRVAEDGTPQRDPPDPPDTNLVEYRRLAAMITAVVMSQWKPPAGRIGFWRIRDWAIKNTRRALGGRIHEQWRRLTAKADPTIWSVQKAVFAATFGDASLLHCPLLYQDNYVVGDIINYRAAASLVAVAESLYRRRLTDSVPPDQHPFDEYLVECDPRDVLESFASWRALCSPTGKSYRSLNRTLMQLPGGVPCGLLSYLPTVILPRPVTDRVELLALLFSRAETRRRVETPLPMKAFLHATRGQVREGMEAVANRLGYPLKHRRSGHVSTFVQYLMDFPEEHRGDLPALVRKSIRWHDAAGWQDRNGFDEMLDDSTPTREPPIPLPAQSGIRFLQSVGDVISEGDEMEHCIGSYARDAVFGSCFLFHVDYRGESASVEVGPGGHVRQSFGPGNTRNQATAYATRVLADWGNGFPENLRVPGRLRL